MDGTIARAGPECKPAQAAAGATIVPGLHGLTPGQILAERLRDSAEGAARRHEQRESDDQGYFDPEPRVSTGWHESRPVPGPRDPHLLASTGEVKSTRDSYLTAVQRVRDAFDLQETRLAESLRRERSGWSAGSIRRAGKMAAKLNALARRIVALEACVEGKLCVRIFACPCCGGTHRSPPLSCNQRTCPSCVPKLRSQAIAKVLDLLEAVDLHRQKHGRQPARWRFLTLTVRSMDQFLPMRRFLAGCWGRLIRHRFWKKEVGACVATFETTHTAAGWHVHVHALIDAFLPRDTICRAWEKITDGAGLAVGVHISEPKGDRKSIARELAKYIAKDLGGASMENTTAWGVAGTVDRLAEFMDGSFRWRTMRTYGDCYDVAKAQDQDGGGLQCRECQIPLVYDSTVWLTVEDHERQRAAARDQKRPASGGATPAAP